MSEYIDYLHEVFAEFGSIESRKMFGGHGVFHGGVMIGLVADDILYLKADNQSKSRFLERDLGPFQYAKGTRTVNMSYYLAPEEALEDATLMREWAQLAYEAALRAKK